MKSSSSTEAAAHDTTPDQILVGVIVRPHGIRGEVAVQVHTDNPGRFAPGATFHTAHSSRRRSGAPEVLRVARAVPHRQGLRVAFDGIADRTAAETLTGIELTVPRADVPEAAAGSYYLFDLAGCRALDEEEGDLGTVVDVVADGGGWLLVVEQERDGATRRVALPFVEEFLVRVDVAARRIDWRLPAGLIEACASRS
jgi:16S rRNA processing protein RimM